MKARKRKVTVIVGDEVSQTIVSLSDALDECDFGRVLLGTIERCIEKSYRNGDDVGLVVPLSVIVKVLE